MNKNDVATDLRLVRRIIHAILERLEIVAKRTSARNREPTFGVFLLIDPLQIVLIPFTAARDAKKSIFG